MSLISCTDNCVYQQDGYCSLSRAASCAEPGCSANCVNYVPRSQNGAERLTDIAHTDQLQSVRNN